eukprot:3420806-Pyramimonas_sp.AAC.1
MAATHEEAANRWLRHFAAEEVGVVVPVADAGAFARSIPSLPQDLTHDIPYEEVFLPTLSNYQRACRTAKPSAASLDGTPGALSRSFATALGALFYPVVVTA